MRKPLLAGNWKMQGSQAFVADLLAAITAKHAQYSSIDLLVCPSFVFLSQAADLLKNSSVLLGAQNLSQHEQGAFTGEVSPSMVHEQGCSHVIVGHSERRQLFHEGSDLVAEKVLAAQQANLTPILCVGETLAEREQDTTFNVIQEQLQAVFAVKEIELSQLIVAYEPVWAIGTGKTATPEQAQEVHAFIRSAFAKQNQAAAEKLVILYGGSVKPENAQGLFEKSDIDGGLVGGASLKAEQFLAIADALQEIRGKQ